MCESDESKVSLIQQKLLEARLTKIDSRLDSILSSTARVEGRGLGGWAEGGGRRESVMTSTASRNDEALLFSASKDGNIAQENPRQRCIDARACVDVYSSNCKSSVRRSSSVQFSEAPVVCSRDCDDPQRGASGSGSNCEGAGAHGSGSDEESAKPEKGGGGGGEGGGASTFAGGVAIDHGGGGRGGGAAGTDAISRLEALLQVQGQRLYSRLEDLQYGVELALVRLACFSHGVEES